jgi:glyoxylase-like metal-dependent hydrolase (beta-lactamase superfamily II)
VDSGYATSEGQIRAALDQISSEPLRHLVNTHWHFDHTDGNQWMHLAGARIVAQLQTRVRMSSTQSIPEFDAYLEPSPTAALPEILFSERYALSVDDEIILLRRYTPAHTDSDISVFMERANVLQTGDTWFNGYYPFIDYNSGGSIDGLVAASKQNLQLADDQTVIVPGHGNVGYRQDLVKFHEMLSATREAVLALKRTGRSVEAVVAARPTAEFDADWGGGFIGPDLFTRLIHRGV